MKRWIKWTAGGAMLLGLAVVATAASGLYLAEQKRNRYIDIKPRPPMRRPSNAGATCTRRAAALIATAHRAWAASS